MAGREILADVETLEDEEPDFTGWQVLDHGTPVGEVSGGEPIPGNPCLYLRRPGGDEVLIPLHPDFIAAVDEDCRILSLNLPEGLL